MTLIFLGKTSLKAIRVQKFTATTTILTKFSLTDIY